MNKSILTLMLASAALIAGCESAEQKAERVKAEQAALVSCPAENVLADISSMLLCRVATQRVRSLNPRIRCVLTITAFFLTGQNLIALLIEVSRQNFRLTALSEGGQKASVLCALVMHGRFIFQVIWPTALTDAQVFQAALR